MTTTGLINRLFDDKPKFHFVTEEDSRRIREKGIELPPGPISLAVGRGVLDWLAENVKKGSVTAETGAGYTTVVLAEIADHHHCFVGDQMEVDKIKAYLPTVDLDPGRVTFHVGSTDRTLPGFTPSAALDFAYIDGCHGYPFPALDWHYFDRVLKVGGIIGMDNGELRPVREHCEFLEENGTYRRIGFVVESYFAAFYEKLCDEDREWAKQAYSRAKRDPVDWRFRTRLRRKISRVVKPWLY
jgi:predicted O-methyltransferase YrrM